LLHRRGRLPGGAGRSRIAGGKQQHPGQDAAGHSDDGRRGAGGRCGQPGDSAQRDRRAERAGVAPQTVYAIFGTKGAVLQALLAQMEDDAGAPEWRDRIAAADDPAAKLEGFAQWNAAMFSASKAAIAAAQSVVVDPAILGLRAEGDRHRRQALASLVDGLADRGVLAAGLSRRRAVDRAWMLTGVEIYLGATDGCGWSDAEYAAWLASLLVDQLLTGGDKPEGPVR